MQDYVFLTDDSCDFPVSYYEENDIALKYLSFNIDGNSYTSREMPPQEFYRHLRNGKMPTTAQVSVSDWVDFFEPILASGRDILYLAFSSGLSGTCGSAMVAARDMKEKYPDRRVVVIDTLCASLGQGLLVRKANNLRKSGASLDEVADWTRKSIPHVSHMVAVNDLMHLHRGGRVSTTSAVAGSLLGIKPIIHMNDGGRLIPIDKIRGRKQSLQAIVDKSIALVGDTPNDFFTVCHSDCEDEANEVAEKIRKSLGIPDYLVHYIGPVIGSHTGPGTIAVFLMANHR